MPWTIRAPVIDQTSGPEAAFSVEDVSAAQEAQIKKADPSWPFFATKAQAEAVVKRANSTFAVSNDPLKALAEALSGRTTLGGQQFGTGQDVAQAAGNVLGIPTLSNLRDLMVRIVKVVGGLALLFVGLNRLTGSNVNLTSAVKSAAKIGAVAA